MARIISGDFVEGESATGENPAFKCDFLYHVIMLCCGLLCCGGKNFVEGLSETIKARRMRERKEEGHSSGERIKERMRGE